ncbi:MAG: aminopeptidase P family protein [Alphaproteobacteria bacterium]|nr:aminopeptidase P family protein [Alphaproteobacteria bacterium]
MSKHDFSADEFAERLARVRRAIAKAGLDWLVIFHPVSIYWLIGADTKSFQAFQCLTVSAKPGPLVILSRLSERAEFLADTLANEVRGWGGGEPADPIDAFAALADDLGLMRGRVGIEVPAYYLHPHHYERIKALLGSALVAEPTNLVHDLKQVKSTREVAYIRQATEIADLAMARAIAAIAPGRTELAVAGEVYGAMLGANGGLPASTLNLVTGPRLAFAHGAPTERQMQTGDGGNIEFGATYRRYTATIGRQFNLGPPGARHREIYDTVRRACDAFIAKVRAGVPAIVPHEAAKAVIAAAGFDRYRVHTSGYGLAPGFPPSWGEPLNLFGGSRYTLEAGMVVTVEPPVFIVEEQLGARIIDNLLVTATGAELLSRTTRDLIVVG